MARKFNKKSLKKKSIHKKRKSPKMLIRKKKYDSGFTVESNYTPYGCYVPKAFF